MNLFILQWILRQKQGTNLCGFYVCEYMMIESNRIPEEIIKVRNMFLFIFYRLNIDNIDITNIFFNSN